MSRATARHILVSSEEQCLELKKEIEAGKDFADLAKAHSSCPSGQRGGELGEFGPGQMVKEFDEAVFGGEVNAVQGPIKTHLVIIYYKLPVAHKTRSGTWTLCPK